MSFDLVIRGGRVIDGTGNPWFIADLGIRGDSIVAVAPRIEAGGARIIDAQGLAVAPGFMRTPMSFVNGVDETTTPDFLSFIWPAIGQGAPCLTSM